jgi:predicted NAD/FAD-binding protein
MPKTIAIIGSGVSGLSAAWLLSQQKNDFIVTVFESAAKIGGHANTVQVNSLIDPSKSIGVDTGFIVCNDTTYPNFLNLMEILNVELLDSTMSFGVSRNNGELEWAGKDLSTIFAQPQNILSFDMYKMIYEIIQFNKQATKIAEEADRLPSNHHPLSKMTLGAFLKRFGYSKFFNENYLLPMTSAIWSSPAETAFDQFPLVTLVQFMRNHKLLQIGNRAQWKTVKGGSKTYVQKIGRVLDDIRLNTKVTSVVRAESNVTVITSNGEREIFDNVIFATHTDQTLEILGEDASDNEKRILGTIAYTDNKAYLHRDLSLMPKNRKTWSSWNYLTNVNDESTSSVMCLSYWMNHLQTYIPTQLYGDLIVTLNPSVPPEQSTVIGEWDYKHPLYSPAGIAAQNELPIIQNQNRTLFAGAWTNYGFHEDGCTSGLVAAEILGAVSPFKVVLNGGRLKYPESLSVPRTVEKSFMDKVLACFKFNKK